MKLSAKTFILNISELTGLSTEVVSTVLEASALLILHNVAETTRSSDISLDSVSIKLPFLGDLLINKVKVNKSFQLELNINSTNAFYKNLRLAYFEGKSLLVDTVLKKYSEIVLDKFRNLV